MIQKENYLDYIRKNSWELMGAFLEECLGWLALDFFQKYGVSSVTIDMGKSYSLQEKLCFPNPRTVLTISAREQILWASHPQLADFKDKLIIKH